ncbi:nesprin-1-like [Carassius gibelio]|uniref:nesprin-1-like n=1 Tax=Carassius gibelio TaxID=101364 RepID=UPI002278491C|nr:nesprin-1-like [Carassius gibelio]XP_052391494.1 nesprin-1-like [Carassius gibelio]
MEGAAAWESVKAGGQSQYTVAYRSQHTCLSTEVVVAEAVGGRDPSPTAQSAVVGRKRRTTGPQRLRACRRCPTGHSLGPVHLGEDKGNYCGGICERTDTDISLYTRSLELWNDINKMANEIECWSAISGAASLLSAHDMEERLSEFKLELDNKEDELKILQTKRTQLKELIRTQHIYTELQVMAADLRKRISHAAEVYDQTKDMYKDFISQRPQLLDLISQISEQLKTSADLLSEFSTSSDPENFVKVKLVERSQKQLEVSLDVASETLRALCGTYPTQQLTLLGDAVSHLVKRNEEVTQLRSQILGSLQDTLLQLFNDCNRGSHGG